MAARDFWRTKRRADVTAQPCKWVTATLSDTADLAKVPKALWVDGAGVLRIAGSDGHPENFTVAAGLVPLSPTRIFSTGTTATGIKLLVE